MIIGKWWANNEIDLVKIDDKVYALYGWDGEEWSQCWECVGDEYMDIGRKGIRIRPIWKEKEVDENGDVLEWEIVGYELI